jgi:hypothetical protein
MNAIAASIIACLASDVGQRWQWDGIHPSTLTLVGAAPAAELATLVLEEPLADCWALAWEGGAA